MPEVKFIDLFAGIGGLRLGFEQAFNKAGFETKCMMTSEIKPHALKTLHRNFSHDYFVGDITKVRNNEIPDFDFLLGGFPCQPFSAGGKRQGFMDTRGTLFFEIERILESKRPYGFILENVEGLVRHDIEKKSDKIGRTLKTIISKLEGLGYKVTTKVLNSSDFGLPQSRKRIFIVGALNDRVDLDGFEPQIVPIKNILDSGLPTIDSKFTKALFSHFSIEELYGKSIKDKRGGDNNIHSWDIELKGPVSREQAELLNMLFKQRRKKKWAEEIGIEWMDGMTLTLDQIKTFFNHSKLEIMLKDLVKKNYLKFEHPKSLVTELTLMGERKFRQENKNLKPGYNIVAGKLSYAINKILDPNGIAPTLVATDMARLVVPDNGGVRSMTLREGMRLFGFPEWFEMPVSVDEGFDLLGNTVAVNVVKSVAERLSHIYSYSTINSIPVCSA